MPSRRRQGRRSRTRGARSWPRSSPACGLRRPRAARGAGGPGAARARPREDHRHRLGGRRQLPRAAAPQPARRDPADGRAALPRLRRQASRRGARRCALEVREPRTEIPAPPAPAPIAAGAEPVPHAAPRRLRLRRRRRSAALGRAAPSDRPRRPRPSAAAGRASSRRRRPRRRGAAAAASAPPPARSAAAPQLGAIQQSIARIQEACQAPPLAPPEYRLLFEIMAKEITDNDLIGAQTLTNITQRAQERGLERAPRRRALRARGGERGRPVVRAGRLRQPVRRPLPQLRGRALPRPGPQPVGRRARPDRCLVRRRHAAPEHAGAHGAAAAAGAAPMPPAPPSAAAAPAAEGSGGGPLVVVRRRTLAQPRSQRARAATAAPPRGRARSSRASCARGCGASLLWSRLADGPRPMRSGSRWLTCRVSSGARYRSARRTTPRRSARPVSPAHAGCRRRRCGSRACGPPAMISRLARCERRPLLLDPHLGLAVEHGQHLLDGMQMRRRSLAGVAPLLKHAQLHRARDGGDVHARLHARPPLLSRLALRDR